MSLPVFSKNKTPQNGEFFTGGEGGIRTREPLWVTRFPSVRAKPDYATSPNQAGRLYQKLKRWLTGSKPSFIQILLVIQAALVDPVYDKLYLVRG